MQWVFNDTRGPWLIANYNYDRNCCRQAGAVIEKSEQKRIIIVHVPSDWQRRR